MKSRKDDKEGKDRGAGKHCALPTWTALQFFDISPSFETTAGVYPQFTCSGLLAVPIHKQRRLRDGISAGVNPLWRGARKGAGAAAISPPKSWFKGAGSNLATGQDDTVSSTTIQYLIQFETDYNQREAREGNFKGWNRECIIISPSSSPPISCDARTRNRPQGRRVPTRKITSINRKNGISS
ncbi:uncharacterized protein H6S33_009520 [Morchella sextelata]|uniref:uncharacterized protein n=1 Tax=Morchella sextelata TaxID=1174677 RepID=UPI001D050DE6|nr:uncharacterized protein H6S33_009520 [Morchella sextelata]KAH0613140.1 hypothetical protein H6S33_009520 [Morchella sextelata]